MSDIALMIDSFPKVLMAGLKMTLPLTALSFTLALLIAVIVALIQYAKVPVLTQLSRFYIWVFRGTPLLVQLFIVFYGLPSIGVRIEAFTAALLVFGVNEGAYCAETIRGALESVNRGQLEAGQCVGLTYPKIMWHIVLPQAFKAAFPSLGNNLIAMLKDTSLAANITVTEMFFATQRIAGRNYRFMTMYILVAIVYLMFSTVLTYLQRYGEKKLNKYEAKGN